MDGRYELLDLVSIDEITSVVRSYCRVLRVSGGVVTHPNDDDASLDDAKGFAKCRLLPVVGFDFDGNELKGGTEFCKSVRRLDHGNRMCMESDLSRAKEAFEKNRAISYECSAIGLIDIVAPIRVGGHHIANVYLGQIRGDDLDFPTAWQNYVTLLAGSSNTRKAVSEQVLKVYFESLTKESETSKIGVLEELLKHVSEVISRKASKQGVIKVIDEVSSEIVSSFDLIEGMKIILAKIHNVVNFHSGGIWFVKDSRLRCYAGQYPKDIGREVLNRNDQYGIVQLICRESKTVKFDRREEINQCVEPSVHNSRTLRGIESFIGTPIVHDGKTVGVIELANKKQFSYTEDDKRLLELLARYIVLYWKANIEMGLLLEIAREKEWQKLFKKVVNSLPLLVNGRQCSIFLRNIYDTILPINVDFHPSSDEHDISKLPAILVETTELDRSRYLYKAFYTPDYEDGLSGGVLCSGELVNVKGGEDARTSGLARTRYKWKGKYRSKDFHKSNSYYKDRPFIAVPIKTLRGDILGLIRIPDAVDGKTIFTRNDEKILTACATEIAHALETYATSWHFQDMRKRIETLSDDVKKNLPTKKDLRDLNKTITQAKSKKISVQLPHKHMLVAIALGMLGYAIARGLLALAGLFL